ncbi:hypothetical protein ACUH93_00865 [Dermabacteraceae bacterium P7006]
MTSTYRSWQAYYPVFLRMVRGLGFWGGYAEHQELASLDGPEESFLRPEPHALAQAPSGYVDIFLKERLPSLLFNDPLTCVLTQPIYGDRIYMSCTQKVASLLTAELDDVFPISAANRLPDSPPHTQLY